jgi:hypothetical protein
MGYYYPSLVAACSLGERILNDLVLKLRDYFDTTDKRIQTKDAFTNWELMVEALQDWNIITDTQKKLFSSLKELRTYSIHYDSSLKTFLQARSISALDIVRDLVPSLFSSMIPEKYRIAGTRGSFFIKKEMESHPFIREYFIPHCIYVGPKHKLTDLTTYPPRYSDEPYPDLEISDEEFAQHFS